MRHMVAELGTINLGMPSTTSSPATASTTNVACLIENDFNYQGNDLGSIISVADYGRCISGCKTAYPSSAYFTYNTFNKDCWCKTSDSGRRIQTGIISGNINCQTTTTAVTTTYAAAAATTTTTTTSTRVQAGFVIVDDSTIPCDPILSASECEFAAQYLNLSDTTVKDDSANPNPTYDPPFCYFEGGSLKFNDGSNTGSCGVGSGSRFDQCICRNIGKMFNCLNENMRDNLIFSLRNLHARVMVFQSLGLELRPSEHPARCRKLQKVMQVCEWI